jgi:hypothetical protein
MLVAYRARQHIEEGQRMASLRHIHQFMNERRVVRLADGRVATIMRVDTWFPENDTQITVWTADNSGRGLAQVERVELKDVVGLGEPALAGVGAESVETVS